MRKIIASQNAPSAIGPYSQAVLANAILYISGQLPINPKTEELIIGIDAETHQVMQNIKAILEEAGMNFSNIVKTSIFLTDMDNFGIVNDIYASYFSHNYPARETIQVAKLPKGANVEISVIAHQD